MPTYDYLVLHCMDARIQRVIHEWLEGLGYLGNIDVVSIAGSCRNREVALQNIQLARDLHGVRRIFLTQHEDCAAYGGHPTFPSRAAERQYLAADMIALKRAIQSRYPEVEVRTLFVERAGDSWKIIDLTLELEPS